jgi:hypothetical protein
MKRIASLLFLCAAALQAQNVLVQYSFDDALTDTGPDTFAVFQNAKGHVRLAANIRYSGYRSIELHDVAGDRDFPELQGYFPERRKGELFFHFAMLIANPDQELNIALAGPQHFTMEKNGIAFWLKTTGGTLRHVSDSIPKKLFRVDPFVWYLVDVRYNISDGVYDLTIHREGSPEPLVDLKNQPNATSAPGSSVDKFSFVGSVYQDDSNVTYYVDDVIIGTDEKVILKPFVAPGRRKLFVDRWRDARTLMLKSPGCPAMLSVADFGLDHTPADIESVPVVKEWRSACERMDPKEFAGLQKKYPNAPIFALSELKALEGDAAVSRWRELEPLLRDDVRFGMIGAVIGTRDAGEDNAELRYFSLLWKGDFAAAARFAEMRNWPEQVGDALFLSGSPSQARPYYEEALKRAPNSYWPTTKLADVFFLLGDTENEKLYRQKMYGHLAE